jgi:5'-nucleotidase
MAYRPLILISNDDGITAPGIQALIAAMQPLGDLLVVAPDSPQSGMGHAISIAKPLRYNRQQLESGIVGYACNGTPADCVKIATGVLVAPRKPDLVVSGINHGPNWSISVFYSGTMSAAIEGAIEGIPSIGFSLCNYSHEADMRAAADVAARVAAQALAQPMPTGMALNVNIPDLPLSDIKGMCITRQAKGRWVEEFDHRSDPNGRDYFWLTGRYLSQDKGDDTDEWAIHNGYVSICPVSVDITAYHAFPVLNQWGIVD